MRAGDIKKFLQAVISSSGRSDLHPEDFSINDNFILGAVKSYVDGCPPSHIADLVDGFITTERLTVEKRVATLKLIKSVLCVMAKSSVTPEEREDLRSLLTAYFI